MKTLDFHIAGDVPIHSLLEALASQSLGFVAVPDLGLLLVHWPITGKSVVERSRENIKTAALEALAAL